MREEDYKIIRKNDVVRVILSNADRHNAFDDKLICGLTDAFNLIARDDTIRVVVLCAEGRSFSAGADLNWMKRMAGYARAENLADASALAKLLHVMNFLEKPLIGLVQGPAYGGGVGLVSVCDIVLATPKAHFCLSEVKLGLVPAVIAPYVVAAIGTRASRRYFASAEIFDAATALRLGLVHELVEPEALHMREGEMIKQILGNGPQAVRVAKKLVFDVDRPVDEALVAKTAELICDLRASEEGQEGLAAFLEKRAPAWKGEG